MVNKDEKTQTYCVICSFDSKYLIPILPFLGCVISCHADKPHLYAQQKPLHIVNLCFGFEVITVCNNCELQELIYPESKKKDYF